jgi:hypothetical protein
MKLLVSLTLEQWQCVIGSLVEQRGKFGSASPIGQELEQTKTEVVQQLQQASQVRLEPETIKRHFGGVS